MIQVTRSVVLGPRHNRPSHLEKPSVPWDAPKSAIKLPNSAQTMNTHSWSRSVATLKNASIHPVGKFHPQMMM